MTTHDEIARRAGATHVLWRDDSPIVYYMDGLTEISMVVQDKQIVAVRGRRWDPKTANQYHRRDLMINDTTKLIRLLETAIENNTALLASARDKLILLSAAQDAAKDGASLELLKDILND
jgi:hypothetical protein